MPKLRLARHLEVGRCQQGRVLCHATGRVAAAQIAVCRGISWGGLGLPWGTRTIPQELVRTLRHGCQTAGEAHRAGQSQFSRPLDSG